MKRPAGTPLASCSLESLSEALESAGFPAYRAAQVFEWFYGKKARRWEDMKNISAPVAAWLEGRFTLMTSRLAAVHPSPDGATKLEIALSDGLAVEAVIIEAPRRVTLCVSCQVGCPLGCAFCATGAGGFERNLAAHEIIEQALHASAQIENKRISHVVFMGMGEPCLNLDACLEAARAFNAACAFGIGARRITISTLGRPACIGRLADFPLEIALAISLHAANDALRRRLVPATPASVGETVEAAQRYFEKTGREVTFEYVLLAGVNDSKAAAAELAELLAARRAFVNLIPYNESEGLAFSRPSARRIAEFRRLLASRGVNVHVRESRGVGAHAACGQLRLSRKADAAP